MELLTEDALAYKDSACQSTDLDVHTDCHVHQCRAEEKYPDVDRDLGNTPIPPLVDEMTEVASHRGKQGLPFSVAICLVIYVFCKV